MGVTHLCNNPKMVCWWSILLLNKNYPKIKEKNCLNNKTKTALIIKKQMNCKAKTLSVNFFNYYYPGGL